MHSSDESDVDAGHDSVELSELDESFQLLAAGATREELDAIAADLDNEQAALLLRLAKHFNTIPSDFSIAADGYGIPRRIGRFRIQREIGSGGFGVVYLARDEAIGRDVAIKVPRRDLMRDSIRRQQMVHEARVAGSLEHPGIIPIYESGCDDETFYIVSAYCNGPDLASWQGRQAAPPTPIEAASFARKLVNAVAHAHDHGIVHRDIKPSNVLLGRDSDVVFSTPLDQSAEAVKFFPLSAYQPRLTDFGLAKLSDQPITDVRSSVIVGTPLYMAPEQLLPDLGPVTTRTDIYALGVLLVELLTGKPLLVGKRYVEILAILQNESPAIEPLVSRKIPTDLRTIIIKCLSRTPENRFESATALAEDLSAFIDGRPISARHSNFVNRSITWCRNARRTREACVFTLVATITMILWLMISMGLVWGPNFPRQDAWESTVQAISVLCVLHLPIMGFVYLGFGDRIWAMTIAAVLLLIGHVLVPALIVADVIGLFDPIYGPYPFFKKSVHSLILLIGLTQLAYLAIGIYSHRWNVRRNMSTMTHVKVTLSS